MVTSRWILSLHTNESSRVHTAIVSVPISNGPDSNGCGVPTAAAAVSYHVSFKLTNTHIDVSPLNCISNPIIKVMITKELQ